MYLRSLQGRQVPVRNQILPAKAASGVLPLSWWEEVGEFSKLKFPAGVFGLSEGHVDGFGKVLESLKIMHKIFLINLWVKRV